MPSGFPTVKSRIAQVIYVLFGIYAAGMIIVTPFAMYDEGAGLIVFAGIGIAGYAIGWAIRWVILGTTTSVLDYFVDTSHLRKRVWQVDHNRSEDA